MSHFTMLVPAADEQELETTLLPYHEYECTGIEKYLEFVPADMEKLRADYEKHGEGRCMDKFADEWAGYIRNADGVYGRTTNPNAKWDWWLIGGRWTGTLQLKSFTAMEHAGDGKPGLMTPPNDNPLRADYARSGDIDWNAMRDEQLNDHMDKWNKYQRAAEIAATSTPSAALVDRAIERHEKTNGKWTVEELTRNFHITQILHDEFDMMLWGRDDDSLALPKDEYIAKFKTRAITYGFLDQDGKWNQRGEMGWFGCDDPDKGTADYDDTFWKFIESLPSDQRVYVVDCHI